MRQPAKKKPVKAAKLVAVFTDAPEPDKALAMARLVVLPSANAAVAMCEYSAVFGAQDLGSLTTALGEAIGKVEAGDMKGVEGMLIAQAHALQAMFTSLARRAAKQEYVSQWEAYMRAAMRAQNQCRQTLETLATVKNPPTIFARQANINNGGQQQVNNGTLPQAGPGRAGALASETQSEQSKLLEVEHGERMDFGAQGAAGGTHQDLAPVGTVNRADERRR
jgi:hypothetical protein